jgi:hypothetical protein
LRAIRELVDRALLELSPAFDRLYAREGRPSIPPERLLRALLMRAFYTVRHSGIPGCRGDGERTGQPQPEATPSRC